MDLVEEMKKLADSVEQAESLTEQEIKELLKIGQAIEELGQVINAYDK